MIDKAAKRPLMWTLDGTTPVPVFDIDDVATKYPTDEQRRIGRDEIGGVVVSTVFLTVDHAWEGPPILFETMIFGGVYDQHQERYRTWRQAALGHLKVVERVRDSQRWSSVVRRWLSCVWEFVTSRLKNQNIEG